MKEQKFFVCKRCGNMVGMIIDAGVPLVCCGENMEELVANTVDASYEKHLPDVSVSGNNITVNIGGEDHPMVPEHYIPWVYVQTKTGGQRKALEAGMKPRVEFCIADDEAVAVFAYCNLHGLWKTSIK